MFQFIFTIQSDEYYNIRNNEDLIGIIIDYNKKKDKKLYHYFFKANIYPNDYENMPWIKYCMSENKENNRIVIPKDNEYLISEIPEEYFGKFIFVFKIYPSIQENK